MLFQKDMITAMPTFKNLYYKITQYIPNTRAWKVRKRKQAMEESQGSIIFSPNFAYN